MTGIAAARMAQGGAAAGFLGYVNEDEDSLLVGEKASRLDNTLTGAAFGGVLGTAAPLVGKAAGKMIPVSVKDVYKKSGERIAKGSGSGSGFGRGGFLSVSDL